MERQRNPGTCRGARTAPAFAKSSIRAAGPLRIAGAHGRDIGPDRMPQNLRQRLALSIMAQPPFASGAGIAQDHFRHRRARRPPLKPAVDQTRLRRRLYAGAGSLDARLRQFEPLRCDAPVFLPFDLLDRMRPGQPEGRDRQRLENASGGEPEAQAAAATARGRCRHCQSTIKTVSAKPTVSLKRKSPSRQSAAIKATKRSSRVNRTNRKPIATMPNRPIATSALKVASATAP